MTASVVLPVYNKSAYLIDCLESIRSQDLHDFEIIAVDDRSTDDSLRILQGLDDSRLRVIQCERNVGPAGAMQRGVDAARGEFIIRVDADDICLPGRFSRQVDFMRSNPGIGVSGGALRLLHAPSSIWRKPSQHEACRVELLFGVAVFQPSIIIRRDELVRSGVRYADEMPRWGEDWMVQLQWSDRMRLANIDEPLIGYRIGEQNSGVGRDRSADLAALTKQAFAHFGLPLADEDVPLAYVIQKHFPKALRAEDVDRFRDWLEDLRVRAMETKRFDPEALGSRLDKAWNDLCFQAPNHGLAVVLRYLRRDHQRSWAKSRYLLSSMLTGKRYVNGARG